MPLNPDMRFKFSPDTKMLAYALGTIPVSMLAGLAAHRLAQRGMLSETPASPRKVERFVRRHLGSNIVLRPVEGLGNASYAQEKDGTGNTVHVITYDPKVKMSIIAHEIGHADRSFPTSPVLDVLGPTALAYGSYHLGKRLGKGEPTGRLPWIAAGLGAGMSAPTLINEHLATQRAKELVDDPAGLAGAYATYALPPALATLEGLGAYALARRLYQKQGCAHSLSRPYGARELQ